jgi:MtN3 and saliva related transmembrane protein
MSTLIGSFAFLLTFLTQLPQAVRVVRTKKTRDISFATYVIISVAALLWVIYGLMNEDLAIWASNIVVFLCSVTILGYKLRYR